MRNRDGGDRHGSALAAEHRVGDMPAIELSNRKEIESSRKHAEPGRERHRTHVDRSRTIRRRAPHSPRPPLERAGARPSQRHQSCPAGRAAMREKPMPAISTGTATTKPAMGPAMPMSKSSRLPGIGCRMRMNARACPSAAAAPAESREARHLRCNSGRRSNGQIRVPRGWRGWRRWTTGRST